MPSILKYMEYSGNYGMVDFVSTSMYYATLSDGDLLFGCSGNCGGKWNDDIGWWALAAMSGSDLFGTSAVISSTAGSSVPWFQVANFTLYQILEDYDSVCGGGVYWSRDRTSTAYNLKYEKSSITNTQIIWLAMRIYEVGGNSAYLNIATDFWKWFVNYATDTSSYMIYDGVYATADSCQVDGKTWSYYYGLMAAAGAMITQATGDDTYLTTGLNYYNYWKTNFVNESGHFYEPWCPSVGCKDPTGFNTPVYESLALLYNRLPSTHADTKAEIKSLMVAQGTYLVDYLGCTSTWNCVRTLDPVPSSYTFANGTNPRDQMEMMSFVNAMVSINGEPTVTSTPTAATAVATTKKSSAAPRAAATVPRGATAFIALALAFGFAVIMA
ncbi:hydrolase 76 protein [Cladochytrium tenue]|nr:hydrolase 76 protein [Cladochytrium tenue]